MKNSTTISEVKVHLIKPNRGLIGFASLVLNENLFIGFIGIHKKLRESGYRLTYPTKAQNGQSRNACYPINKTLSQSIEAAVFKELEVVIKNLNGGYHCS